MLAKVLLAELTVRSLIISLAFVVGSKRETSREKLTSFECGFEPMRKSRLRFCLRFFVTALVFLVFDVEVVLLILYLQLSAVDAGWPVVGVVFGFGVILLLGLFHELNEGSVDWL